VPSKLPRRSSQSVLSYGQRRMESPNPPEFDCYQRNKLRWSQCEDTWIVCNTCSFCRQRTSRRTCVIRHRTDEVLLEQHTVSDGQAASPVKEGANHAQSLSCLHSYLVDVCRPGKWCIKGHPNIPCCFDPLYWLSEKLHWSGFWIRLVALTDSTTMLFETLMAILQFRRQSSSLPR
jgi:hypothetical protein